MQLQKTIPVHGFPNFKHILIYTAFTCDLNCWLFHPLKLTSQIKTMRCKYPTFRMKIPTIQCAKHSLSDLPTPRALSVLPGTRIPDIFVTHFGWELARKPLRTIRQRWSQNGKGKGRCLFVNRKPQLG